MTTVTARYRLSVVDPDTDTGRELARRFVAGDAHALDEIIAAHGQAIHGFCRRAAGADVAADLTQETFVAAWRSAHRFDPERGALGGWLTGIAKNKVRDHFRSRRLVPVDAHSAAAIADGADGDDLIDDLAEQMLVADAIAHLPSKMRETVELAFFTGLTHPEIAERTGRPLGSVKSDIRRGLARLRRELEGLDATA